MKLASAFLLMPCGLLLGAAPVDFNRDVRPILAENCFACHGQDAAKRKGKLRLDTREGQRKEGVIAAGKPDESDLILRIFSADDDERMPPPEAHRTLTTAQKETLRRWIVEGAAFAEHWAFVPPRRPEFPGRVGSPSRPELQRGSRVGAQAASEKQPHLQSTNPIDAFVRAKLGEHGLSPSPEADRARWLRRVTFDLTGLPPTLVEVDAFIADRSANAFEKVVDRLLASPRFGEHLATDWLDVARFADTHGYQMDRPRPMWPYRDWVIDAFNRNLRYDQFLTEQLAGDLLPNATRDQRLATAFNRLHAQNEEGGIVDEEYRVAYVNDRTVTFGTAVLGLTLECARCHDHKFDPITQRDFYSLSAFFQNIDEAGAISYKNFSDIMPPPVLKLPDAVAEQKLAELTQKITAQEAKLTVAREAAAKDFEAWLKTRTNSDVAVDGAIVALDFDEMTDGVTPNRITPAQSAKVVDTAGIGEGVRGGGAALGGDNGFSLADAPTLTRGDAFTFSLWLRVDGDLRAPSSDPTAPGDRVPPKHAERAIVFHRSLAYTDAGSRGYELVLENGRAAFALHRHWPGSSLKVVTLQTLPIATWTHVTLTYDGSSRAAGARIYVNGVAAPVEVIRDKLGGDITYDKEKQPPLLIGHRMRDSGFRGGRVDEFRIFARELSPLEAAHLAGRSDFADAWRSSADKLSREQRVALRDHYVRTVAPGVRAESEALAALRRDYAKTLDAVPDVMVMEELPKPRPAYVLKRGNYDQPGEEVRADTPAALLPFAKNLPRNRLGLARWATDPRNPLTARVAVNRFWQMMFERGLVESSDNFGATGTPPSHPELLDRLAHDFVASGWNVKAFFKQVALSATYRQSSHASTALIARDPQNLLLGRGPSRRLSAEMLRDQALAASGLLVEKIGGPSVKPYQPPGLWEEIAMGKPKYEQGKGDDLHRRSLYTFIKRTVPPPAMITFDATDRANCTVRRQATSTPLQALALLNDTQLLEAARFIGVRMLREGGATPAEQVRFAFRLVTSRAPSERETATLVTAMAEQEEIFRTDAAAATTLLAVGEARVDSSLPVARLAAATMVVSLLLNHDEAVMRR
jgi:hypothetical protein